MKKIIIILGLILTYIANAQRREIYPIVPGSGTGSGIPSVTSISPGTNVLETVLSNAPNTGASYQLGAGTYRVTPSIPGIGQAGGYVGHTRAINLFSRTNISIVGVPGQTIIDGSHAFDATNNLGAVLLMTNCLDIYFYGITFKGQFLTNFTLYMNNAAWGGVEIYNSRNITFDNCILKDHMDQGYYDLAAQSGLTPHSTNVSILGGLVQNVGSSRTNIGIAADGSGVIPTGWLIDGVTFRDNWRDIEPYDENSDGYPFTTCVIRNCRFLNTLEAMITTGGSTNGHGVVIENNYFANDTGYTRRGTNIYPVNTAIQWNAGQSPKILRNRIYNTFYGIVVTPAADMNGVQIIGNTIDTIGDAAGGNGNGHGIIIGDASFNALRVRHSLIADNFITQCESYAIQLQGIADSVFLNNRLYEPVKTAGLDAFRIFDGSAANNSNLLFMGNSIIDSGTVDTDSGFNIETANPRLLRFVDNLIQGPVVLYANSAPRNEVSILGPTRTYTFTNDFPSLGVGANFTTNFTALGVKTNDLVLGMVPTQLRTAGNSTNITVSFWPGTDVINYQVQAIQAADPQSVRINVTVRQVEPY